MPERAEIFGTDNGPECPKCACTVWGYIVHGEDWRFEAASCCIGCGHDETFVTSSMPDDGKACREAHERWRSETERIEAYKQHLSATG